VPEIMPTKWPPDWVFRHFDQPYQLVPGDLLPVAVSTSATILVHCKCSNCGDVGYVYARRIGPKGRATWIEDRELRAELIASPCPVCRGDALDEYLAEVSGLAGLVLDGKPMLDIRVSDAKPLAGQEEAFRVAWQLLSELPEPHSWALFSGDYGRGKTHILAGLANGCRVARLRSLYATSEQILAALKATYEDGATERTAAVRYRFETMPVLVLDEINRVRWTAWAGEQLFAVLNSRHTSGRATWYGSNLGPSALEQTSEELAALVSRMSSGYMVALTGEDLRPAGRQQMSLPDRFVE
jgi:hypothetical protein